MDFLYKTGIGFGVKVVIVGIGCLIATGLGIAANRIIHPYLIFSHEAIDKLSDLFINSLLNGCTERCIVGDNQTEWE